MSKTFDELLESVNPGDTVTGFLKADLKTTHHQELQKAREEERERILLWIFENMLDENDQYWDEDFETWKDLSWIASEITPNQSELDQPNK